MTKKYGERFMCPSAVIVAIIREKDGVEEVLLQKRKNTGFADGEWDLSVAGHVEEGESCVKALEREVREELGIRVDGYDAEFLALVHKKDRDAEGNTVVYYNVYFVCYLMPGTDEGIEVSDPGRVEEIKWVPADMLPGDVMWDRKSVFESCYGRGPAFFEPGWDDFLSGE